MQQLLNETSLYSIPMQNIFDIIVQPSEMTIIILKAQPLLGSPKHRTPRFDRGVLADWFLSPVKNIPVISFSTQMVTLVSSVSVGTLCFTSKKGRTDFLAIFGYLFERNT